MTHVGQDRHDLRGATTDELGIDHPLGDIDVREEPPVPVPLLGVELHTNLLARDQLAVGLDGVAHRGLGARRLAVGLQGVDSDVADGLGAFAQIDQNRLAVDDVDDLTDEHLGSHPSRALLRAHPRRPQLLTGQHDLVARQEQAALGRVQHQLDAGARDLVNRAVLEARQGKRPALAIAREVDRGIDRSSRAA